jgi:hypothetical protein
VSNGHIRSEVNKRLDSIRTLKAEIDWLLKDQRVKIVSNYNGQPFGSSHKPMTGQAATVKRISLSEWKGPIVHLFIDDQRCSLNMEEIEFCDEAEGK